MGSVISRPPNDALKRSNVKLQAQHVSAFNGNAIKWRSWKKKTRAAIGTAGLLGALDDQTYASRNKSDNEIIFHLLQVATSDGSASHLVDMHENTKDGHAAYVELVKWYEGDELTTETAEDIRSKLDKLNLSTRFSASEYINLFQAYNKQLTELGEEYTKSKTVNIFLTQISDPDYNETKSLCIENRHPLEVCIQRIRSRERRITREKGSRKKIEISVRRETNENSSQSGVVDIKDHLTEFGYYSIPNEVWGELSNDDKSYIKKFNEKVRSKYRNSPSNYRERKVTNRRILRYEEIDDENTSPNKKQKTVQFQDDKVNSNSDEKKEGYNGNKNDELTNRREIISFRTRQEISDGKK